MSLIQRCVATALSALLLVGQAHAQTPPAPAVDNSPDPATLRAIESQVAQIRGLAQVAEPDLHLLDHTALKALLVDQFARDYLPSQREIDQKEMVALGFIQPTDDLVQIELNLLNDQVIGVYDPDTKALYVVSDQGAFGPAARVAYAHEFNHALQDQHFDLNGIAPKHPDSNDHNLAVHGLIEGDAVMLQSLWAQQSLTHDELVQLLSAGGSDAGLAEAPPIVRGELLFPYTDGFAFVRDAYRRAGNSYAAIDAIFADPPESTSQVLHPDRYRAHVHPATPALVDLAGNLGTDWRDVGSGVLGELDTRILLQQWGTPSFEASRVAAGWAGDRWQLVERGGRAAIELKSTWTSATAASDFYSAYTRGLQQRFAGATVEESSDARQALTTADYATDVRLLGSDVLAVIGPDRDTTLAIVGLLTSSAP
jgi:hypothetical protein